MKIVVPIMPTSLEEAQELELSRFEGGRHYRMACRFFR